MWEHKSKSKLDEWKRKSLKSSLICARFIFGRWGPGKMVSVFTSEKSVFVQVKSQCLYEWKVSDCTSEKSAFVQVKIQCLYKWKVSVCTSEKSVFVQVKISVCTRENSVFLQVKSQCLYTWKVSVFKSEKFTRSDRVYTSGKFLSNIPDVGTMLKKILKPVSPSFETHSLLYMLDWEQRVSETLFLSLGPCENLNLAVLRNCRSVYCP